MKRYAVALTAVLALAGCSNDPPPLDAPAAQQEETLPEMPPNDEAEILDLGQGVEMEGNNGGYAVHGYHSVPPYQASHGCARVPLWAARGVYDRWSIGDTVYVL